jgi:MoxR-like ATPase
MPIKGYYVRPEEGIALRAMEKRTGALNCVLLMGPPGTGKTFFSEAVAERWEATYLYYQCHNWTDTEDLCFGVHVGRVVAGVKHAHEAYEAGILAKAAEASKEGRVVICLDELDKAPEKAEAILLDFLQNGRVFGPSREIYQAKLENLCVIITSNNIRPLLEATMRRCFRVTMGFLPPEVESDIIRKRTGAPMGAIRLIVRAAGFIRKHGQTAPSIQEMVRLAEDLSVATSVGDTEILVRGWLTKQPDDWDALIRNIKNVSEALYGESRR